MKTVKGMFTGVAVVLAVVLLLTVMVGIPVLAAVTAPVETAAAQGPEDVPGCPAQVNYVFSTKEDMSLDALRSQVNELPGHRLPENGRYLVQNILTAQAVLLPNGAWRLVVLLEVWDTCTRP